MLNINQSLSKMNLNEIYLKEGFLDIRYINGANKKNDRKLSQFFYLATD